VNAGFPQESPRALDLALLALLAFLLRLATIVATADSTLFSDMAEYDVRAHILLERRRFEFDAWRGPGYPLVLALLYALPGPDLLAARIGNAVLAGLSAMLTAVLATGFVGRRAALAAGGVVAAYPALVLSSVYVMPEGLYGCLTLGALLLGGRMTGAASSTAGVFAGYAALTRSLGVALVPAIVLGSLIHDWRARRWRRPIVCSALLSAAFALTIAPWLWHTTRASGGPMLDSSSAFNLLAGNNPRATGRLEIPNVTWILETYLVGARDEAERNRRGIRGSWNWLASNPGAWLKLLPAKAGYLWGLEGREHVWLYSHSYFGARSPGTVWIWGAVILISFPVLAVPALFGLLRPGLTSRLTGLHIVLLLATVTGLHLASFGESRFHLPLVPVLAILAARGLAATHERFTHVRYAACAVAVLALTTAWATQAPDLIHRLLRLAAPDGWQSALQY
jgi:4-amino-4-deoxy-L-arabinose transferase-like glycosyltransferase